MKLRPKRSTLHARAELVIPWLANGSLPGEADPAVREHIATCAECREDYEEQLRVRAAMRAEGPLVFAAESSYQKLLARIRTAASDPLENSGFTPEIPPEADPWAERAARPRSPQAVRWLAAAVVLQAFALGGGAWLWHSHRTVPTTSYFTLTSPSASYETGAHARVVFRTDLSVGALRQVLGSVGAHIIDGPADGDVYTLGFAQPSASATPLDGRLAALRANPAVLFAEPVQEGVR